MRKDVTFPAADTWCAGWLYRPTGIQRPPLVVLGHGLGAVREMRLDAYAERFAAAGMAVLVFTHRHFGDSGGQPRQLLSVKRQLEDWEAALRYGAALDDVDGSRIAIWGSSFGGGHVIEIAAAHPELVAVVTQCPFTDGPASALALGPRSTLKVLPFVIRDLVARARGSRPVLVAVAGRPGSAALMTAADVVPGYQALLPPGLDHVNAASARVVLDIIRYRPGRSTRRVSAPVLFCVSESDSVAPARATLRHARRAPRGEIVTTPAGHFDLYLGEPFEQLVDEQTRFLVRHLKPRPDLRLLPLRNEKAS